MKIDEQQLRTLIRSRLLQERGQTKVGPEGEPASLPGSEDPSPGSEDPSQPAPGASGEVQGSDKVSSLSPSAQPVFQAFLDAATAAGYDIRITSARRVPSHQWNLKYNSSSALTPAEPCRSDHQYGYALDINATRTSDGKEINSRSPDSDWQPIVDIAAAQNPKIHWQGASDRVHFYVRKSLGVKKTKCANFYTQHLGTRDKSAWGSAPMKALEQDPSKKNRFGQTIQDILEIPDMSIFAEGMVRITESDLRQLIKNRLLQEREQSNLSDDEEAPQAEQPATFEAGESPSPNHVAVSYSPTGPEKRVNRRAKLNQLQVNAWQWLSPLLPKRSRLTSGFRTQDDQDRIINSYASSNGIGGTLQQKWQALKDRGFYIGRNIGVGHGSGEAIDVSGANLQSIKSIVERVTADPEIPVKFAAFSGSRPVSIVEPANNAVHVHILEAAPINEELRSLIMDKWGDIGGTGGGLD